ncbi:hypothetical protein EFY79_04000 [Hanamia caeni]|jgi:hypothetical protein|uniref:Uncharacterized protein n=1 Tax=Hanamia caeni TaxID=2294116 RepID=A0A3M9NNU4_9BACT|nr:hypothetical protein EFY79_04000 [Hanamia caeni]
MGKVKNNLEFSLIAQKESRAIEKGLRKVSQKLIEEEKARNGYLVISDKKGNIKKVPAKDL